MCVSTSIHGSLLYGSIICDYGYFMQVLKLFFFVAWLKWWKDFYTGVGGDFLVFAVVK